MKILCLILSIYVIFLSAKPCCNDNDCRDEISVKKELSTQSSSDHKECPGCSPFFTCGTCIGFILPKSLTVLLPAISEDQPAFYTFYKHPYIEKVALFTWLPPKIS